MREQNPAMALLDWYDLNARTMGWRVSPADRARGTKPDPYHVWLSEIMLQQTTVAAVGPYFDRFTKRWPTVQQLAAAKPADVMAQWAGLGYYARARNLLKCANIIAHDFGGHFPDTYDRLLDLPGVGPYTAAALAAIAFDQPETVVDGNVERVMSRLFQIETPLPSSKPELKSMAARLTPQTRPGDYAQAVMDLGATICTPKSPDCSHCPWADICLAHASNSQARLPARTPKKPKPRLLGLAYVGQRDDGAWLLETRPDKGLLGGMLGWPGTDWQIEPPEPRPPAPGNWRTCDEPVRHTFTHFHLSLTILTTTLPHGSNPDRGQFIAGGDFDPSNLPTLMAKAHKQAVAFHHADRPSLTGKI